MSNSVQKLLLGPRFGQLVKLENSLDGADRTFMLLQYGSGLIAALAAKGAVPLSLSAIQKLRLIQDKCSEWRTLGRFLGLLAMARWGATLTKKTHWSEWLRWASITLYYPCEHLAYLSSIGVLSLSPAKRARLSLLSVHLWGIYLVIEIQRLVQQLGVDKKLKAQMGLHKKTDEKSNGGAYEQQQQPGLSKKEAEVAENSLNSQLAYFPMAVHWGKPGGVLPAGLTDLFPLLAAYYGFKKSWALSSA